jgi:phosphoenolpyruvate carboxylase
MKNIFAIVLIAFLSSSLFAQEAPVQAKINNVEKFNTAKSQGVFEIQMPASSSKETVEKTAAYYTQFFTVNFDATTQIAKIKMIQNNFESRHVIKRFMVANKIQEVAVGSTVLPLDLFFDQYIK